MKLHPSGLLLFALTGCSFPIFQAKVFPVPTWRLNLGYGNLLKAKFVYETIIFLPVNANVEGWDASPGMN